MNRIFIILLILVLGLIILIAGGAVGVLYQTQKDAPQIEKLQIMESTVKELSSRVVPSIAAYGEAKNIEGRNITLTYEGDSLTVRVKDNAQIYSLIPENTSGQRNSGRRQIELKDIKKNDTLSIVLKVLPNGQIEGQMVTIMPSFNNLTIPPEATK